MIVLSYLWLLALVPLLVEKNDPEVQWHAKHGLVLTVAEVILWIAVFVVQIIATHIPFLGCIISILWLAVWIGVIILHILCIVKGVKGERFLIPGISEYANRF